MRQFLGLGTYPLQGLHEHLQTCGDGQTLGWTPVSGCALQLLALLWDAVGIS